jgi:hypothetical protein
MPRLTDRQWRNMRAEYETHGPALSALAQKYNIGRESVYKRRKREGWVQGGRQPEVPVVTDLVEEMDRRDGPDVSPPPEFATGYDAGDIVPDTSTAAEYEARIAELEQQLADATTTASGLAHVPFFATVEELIEGLGDEVLTNAATAALGHINLERMKVGQLPLDFNAHPEVLAEQINKIATELIARRTRFRGRVRQRVIKMWDPKNKIQRQIAVEDQVNNEAANEGIAIWKAKDAGLLIMDPYRCQALDCWELAKTQEDGKTMTLNGYCSETCRATDPYIKAPHPEGLSTSFQSLRR